MQEKRLILCEFKDTPSNGAEFFAANEAANEMTWFIRHFLMIHYYILSILRPFTLRSPHKLLGKFTICLKLFFVLLHLFVF